jgi:hypothetical protein
MKIGIRHNLLYPLMLIIFSFFRKIDSILMFEIIEFKCSLLLTLLMFLSEFFSGLILFQYHLTFLKRERKSTFMGIELIEGQTDINSPDSSIKIYLLIFLATLFDFIEFILQTYHIPSKFDDASISIDIRLRSILILCSAFCCYFILKFPIFRHQIFSLIIILICLIIVIFSEYYFVYYLGKNDQIHYLLFLAFICHIFNSFLDLVEKYLLEYDFVNPFKMLMVEGLFGSIITTSYYFLPNISFEINNSKGMEEAKYIILLVTFLVIYFLLSGARNSYRVTTNKLYSPMTRTLADSILDPLLIIYYYFADHDFKVNGKRNIFYFIVNLITSIIMVFCSCVYNELIVLFCCKLEYDTHHEVSIRAKEIEKAYELSSEESSDLYSSFNSNSDINSEKSAKSNKNIFE